MENDGSVVYPYFHVVDDSAAVAQCRNHGFSDALDFRLPLLGFFQNEQAGGPAIQQTLAVETFEIAKGRFLGVFLELLLLLVKLPYRVDVFRCEVSEEREGVSLFGLSSYNGGGVGLE